MAKTHVSCNNTFSRLGFPGTIYMHLLWSLKTANCDKRFLYGTSSVPALEWSHNWLWTLAVVNKSKLSAWDTRNCLALKGGHSQSAVLSTKETFWYIQHEVSTGSFHTKPNNPGWCCVCAWGSLQPWPSCSYGHQERPWKKETGTCF